MKVTVVFLHRSGEIVGENKRVLSIDLDNEATLKDLVIYIRDNVNKRLGEGLLSSRIVLSILVNGVPVIDWNYKLADNSRIVFLTPEMGG
ncbi:MAG: hypothetical protein N3E36_02710 [Sulfolobales archaeon]|nr:hypothetical protein [Sulfolobales archaeon]MCX8198927.1 hypothetical protein [Sulfolobales archaeon]MDW8169905.1 hypothetical protein [Desulfurococcaceae archaeon]